MGDADGVVEAPPSTYSNVSRLPDAIAGDEESLEQSLLTKLTAMRQLAVYQHHGFWQCMDTPREMDLLNELWRQDKAAWAVWR